MTMFHGLRAAGYLDATSRGTNLLDTGAPLLRRLRDAPTAKYVAVGALEPQFYAELLRLLGSTRTSCRRRWTRSSWPGCKERLAEVFRTQTRDEWCGAVRGHRRVLRAGAHARRGAAAPAQRARARDVRRGRRRGAARARAALQPHPGASRGRRRGSRRTHRSRACGSGGRRRSAGGAARARAPWADLGVFHNGPLRPAWRPREPARQASPTCEARCRRCR